MTDALMALARRHLSKSARRRLIRYSRWPMVGWVRFGSLRRLHPISRTWGFDRGLPIDRYYIEQFLQSHMSDLRGHGLEVKEDLYSSRFGGAALAKLDVLHPVPGNPHATIVADLTMGDGLPSNTFDFIVLTQTLHLIYDVRAAMTTLYRVLKPGGVLLTTVSGISKISGDDMVRWGHHWSFTSRSAERLFREFFPADAVTVHAWGNVLSAVAFLHGVASGELRQQELDHRDPDYEVLISVRAVKSLAP